MQILLLSAGKSSSGKESSVQEHKEQLEYQLQQVLTVLHGHSGRELQLQWTADRQERDCQLHFLLHAIPWRDYGKAEKVPQDVFVLYLWFTKTDYKKAFSQPTMQK